MKISKTEAYVALAAFLSPLILGLIGGYFLLYKEKKYRKSGQIVMVFSVLWGIATVILAYYADTGVMPF